jgi:hypothetical protein
METTSKPRIAFGFNWNQAVSAELSATSVQRASAKWRTFGQKTDTEFIRVGSRQTVKGEENTTSVCSPLAVPTRA